MNDWSARDLQATEMKVGLGPAKGKDFATSLGAHLVTKEELDVYRNGDRYELEMTAHVNGKLLSKGNFQDIYYTFAEMIERASEDVTLYPGDVIGSGTVGTGCILELGTEEWLQDGDVVELTITGLGTLRNTVKKKWKQVMGMFYRHMGSYLINDTYNSVKKMDKLYREQVMGTKGFSGTQSILYHHYMPTEVGHAALSHSCQLQYEEDVALAHRHFRTKENKKLAMQ